MKNPFNKNTGAELVRSPIAVLAIILFLMVAAFLIATKGITISLAFISLPFLVIYLYSFFKEPRIGLISVLVMSFIAIALVRYIKGLPFGLSIDVLLILTFLAIFFKHYYSHADWSVLKNDLVYLSLVWFIYNFMELANPEAVSAAAWFYAMRGVALYMILVIPLVYMLFDHPKYVDRFLYIWGAFSILASIKGIIQLHIGVDPVEKAWLDAGGAVTHILFGKLRVFSFYSDAGQFGAAQGHAMVMGFIVGLNTKDRKKKLFFLTLGLLSTYGLFISGTRGAIAVPFGGAMMYFILKKNVKIMILGGILGIGAFVFFKYTTIGNGNYHINRMRTAFDPNDKSLQVRLENQRKLKVYLSSRPFGGGIGSSGNWGLRFSPNTFLAQTPTDSWYVKIWAEQGIIGLFLHIFILLYIIIKSGYYIMFKVKDPELNAKMIALNAGIWGIMLASYGNAVLGQLPTGILIYFSMAFLFMSPKLDEILRNEKEQMKLHGSPEKKSFIKDFMRLEP